MFFLGHLAVLILLVPALCFSNSKDPREVFELATKMRLKPMPQLSSKNEALYELGEALFFEKELSGNRNISCGSCHDPRFYSGDGLSLGIGEGAQFGDVVKLLKGKILKRHTPQLINLGRPDILHYFWDGRVSYSIQHKSIMTPEENLNKKDPYLGKVYKALSGPLAAQALFPLLSPEEMLGQMHENELASLASNHEKWQGIVRRLFQPHLFRKYEKLIQRAFVDMAINEFNVGHIGTAMAEFQKYFYQSTNSPYDQFLRGDLLAMDQSSIDGLDVFMRKGRCVGCHGGMHLSRFQFRSSGAPQIGVKDNFEDSGRKAVTGRNQDLFKFKTTSLRNVALTAPYMHSGAITTLEGVVEHYNNIQLQLNNFVIPDEVVKFYGEQVFYDTDPKRNEIRRLQVEGSIFLMGLRLTKKEKGDLLYFLKYGLTDQDFKKRMDKYSQKSF